MVAIKNILNWTIALSIIPIIFGFFGGLGNWSVWMGLKIFIYTWGAMIIVPFALRYNKKELKANHPEIFTDEG